ncbi:MAG: hypothetical protein WD577_07100 [Bacteroidales bacterium]
MKTLKTTIDSFVTDAITRNEMNYLFGGGEPIDMIIPPDDDDEEPK